MCITNRVTPQRVADALLAAGASSHIGDLLALLLTLSLHRYWNTCY